MRSAIRIDNNRGATGLRRAVGMAPVGASLISMGVRIEICGTSMQAVKDLLAGGNGVLGFDGGRRFFVPEI